MVRYRITQITLYLSLNFLTNIFFSIFHSNRKFWKTCLNFEGQKPFFRQGQRYLIARKPLAKKTWKLELWFPEPHLKFQTSLVYGKSLTTFFSSKFPTYVMIIHSFILERGLQYLVEILQRGRQPLFVILSCNLAGQHNSSSKNIKAGQHNELGLDSYA